MASVDSMVWLDEVEYNHCGGPRLAAKLVITPKARVTVAVEGIGDLMRKVWREEESGEPIHTLVERDGKYGVPIEYGMGLDIDVYDDTAPGVAFTPRSLPDPNHPRAAPGQGKFFDDVYRSVTEHFTTFAVAPTGMGKTVTILNTIGKVGTTALVIVPSSLLATQWKEEAIRHLGLLPEEIGTVGGGAMSWKGKKLVIIIIHNLFLKTYPNRFYRYFGFVGWDEAHKLGAHEFSRTMSMFPAKYKLAVSATPTRKDGMDKLIYNYFGEPSVLAVAPAMAITCYRVPFPIIGKTQWIDRCRNDVRPMKWLASLEMRNEMLVRLIVRQYRDGRQILVLSRFIDHLELLIKMCIKAGVPEKVMGQLSRTTKGGAKVGNAYLDFVKGSATIIFATYSIAKEGLDIPRIDCGIEAMPVADNVQGIGRARRLLPGKLDPLWFTVEDLNVSLFVRYSKSRLRGFEETNVTIKQHPPI